MDNREIIDVFDNYRGLPIYTESPEVGAAYRAEYLSSVRALIEEWRGEGAKKRLAFMPPEEFGRDPERFRALYVNMLGRPLTELEKYRAISPVPPAKEIFVAEDGQARISRVTLEVMPGFTFYGILFRPLDLKAGEKRHLVISQHGGGGTPESCSDFYGKNNYNRMTRRHLERGSVVFAPQMLLWAKEWGTPADRGTLDAHMKQFGGSITALEVFCHMRTIDWLVSCPR